MRNGGRLKPINIVCISYFEVDGKYAKIVCGPSTYKIRKTLKELNLRLPDHFVRIHSGYIVNALKIISINVSEGFVELHEQNIPLSRNYKNDLLDQFVMI